MLVGSPLIAQGEESGYTFEIHNKTTSKITQLMVSEDGKTWGQFDLGGGVDAGQSAKMAWDKSTDGQNCEQQVKAVYADKSESEADTFDFCEDGLTLEFS